MPYKSKIACSHPRCPTLVEPNTGGLCIKHQKVRHKQYQQNRTDQDHSKIYGTRAWRLCRKQALQRDEGWCVICKENPAVLVDHIKELKDGGSPYSIENLQSLCQGCHNKKTSDVAKAR